MDCRVKECTTWRSQLEGSSERQSPRLVARAGLPFSHSVLKMTDTLLEILLIRIHLQPQQIG